MPSPSQTPATIDGTPGDSPVVHLTRRARIAAERAAAGQASGSVPTSLLAPVADRFDDAAAYPVTPAAPASPVLPASSAAPLTPPAPSSPMLPSAAVQAAPTSPAVAFDELVGIDAAPSTTTVPIVLPAAVTPSAPAPTRRRDQRAERAAGPRRTDRRPLRRTPRQQGPAPVSPRGSSFRRTASRATAVGAVLFTAGLVVSTSLPAQALWTTQDARTVNVSATAAHAQTLSVGDAAAVGGTNRDAYTVSDLAQYQNTDSSTFTNDPDGTIQWPFLTGVPITSGFGGRNVEGCSFCSTNHMGVDFAPGEGTPIRVIAAGTVIKVQADDGGFGNDVWVEHDVDGKQFVSVYGHMEDNSFQVVQGQQVTVGDVLGKVGSTGNSTGPHLHLEIHVDDVPVDPLTWLKANAN